GSVTASSGGGSAGKTSIGSETPLSLAGATLRAGGSTGKGSKGAEVSSTTALLVGVRRTGTSKETRSAMAANAKNSWKFPPHIVAGNRAGCEPVGQFDLGRFE